MSTIAFGLDFGTTNSALSLNKDGKVEIIDIDEYNPVGKTLRSVLYFDEEKNVYAGQEAVNHYIADGATGRFIQSIKSFLPSNLFEYTIIQRRKYELEELIAIILRKIKNKGEEFAEQEIDSVVIGRPVVFSENKEKDKLAEERLKKAAILAGFKHITFQLEPVAAALSFEKSLSSEEDKLVFIGDFGGGTSDFTVIKLGVDTKPHDRKKDVLSLDGISIAGDTFDSGLMWEKIAKYFGKNVKYQDVMGRQWLDMPTHIIRKLCQWNLIPQLRDKKIRGYVRQIKQTADDKKALDNLQNLIEDNYGFMLFQAIEKAKIELSSIEDSNIIFEERGLLIRETVNRKGFENIIQKDVAKIEKCINATLEAARINPSDIDVVFTTGGTSHIPCIKDIFIRKFGEEKMKQMNVFTSVAYGLGLSADL